jgi:formylglycine-generating enzyme required for sulfatase activity
VPLKLHRPKKARPWKIWHALVAAGAAALLVAGVFCLWLWQRGASAESALKEAVSAAEFQAAQGRLDDALGGLDAALARYRVQSDAPDSSDSAVAAPAEQLRRELRERKAAAERARLEKQAGLVAEGDRLLKELKYAEALAAYQQARALGETAEISDKMASAERWLVEAERKQADTEAARRAKEHRRREEAEAEAKRRRDYETALAEARRCLGEGEDTLDQAREQAARARELARSGEEIEGAVVVQDQVAEALKQRRCWAGVVDFTLDASVKADLTGSAVAVKLEQALSGRYRLVTRSQVAKALGELKFQASDLADRGKAQRFGQQVGAEFLVTGSVVQIGREITIAAQIFRVATGAIRQTADNTALSLEEMDTAFFADIARMLEMTDAEKQAWLDEQRNYPKYLAEGRKLADLEKWADAVRALETARRAKRTPEVEALLATAREKAEEARLVAERRAAHDLACAEGSRLLREEKWPEAEAAFNRALAVRGHEQSQAARDGLEQARGGAARAAFEAACGEGDALLTARRWAEAEAAFNRALEALPADARGRAAAGAAHARLGAAVDRAEAAKAKADWAGVAAAAGGIGPIGPMGPMAAGLAGRLAALRAEAEGHLVPTWRLVATVDDREVPATITIGGQTHTAPRTFTLEEGKHYSAEFSYEAGGRKYRADAVTVTADWKGERERRVALEEARGPVAGRDAEVEGLGLKLVWIAPGSFQMGSNNGDSDETPVHQVRISRGFWLGKYEVTQQEYEALMGSNPSHFKGPRNPVETVSWNDAVAFCRKLTERERQAGRLPAGYEYRLPTEAEWEYACRAGTTTVYSWGDQFGEGNCNAENDKGSNEDKQCRYFRSRGMPVDSTMPVGQFGPNAWGLHDMHGNVWEWCLDWCDEKYYGRSPGVDPLNTQAASGRVGRGGCWGCSAGFVRSAFRVGFRPGDTCGNLGFRACLAPRSEGQ